MFDTCHYCGKPVVWIRHLQRQGMFVKRLKNHAVFLNGDGRHETMLYATRDHVVPLSRGGGKIADNIVVACHPCNNAKGDGGPRIYTPPVKEAAERHWPNPWLRRWPD